MKTTTFYGKKWLIFLAVSLVVSFSQATVYYVKPASLGGDDTAGDGSSWETAYATPNKAFEVAVAAGDTVAIMQGTYEMTAELKSGNSKPTNIQIQGGYTGVDDERVIDPTNTIWEYNNTATRVLSTTYGSGLVFSGITIQNISFNGYGAFAQIPAKSSFTMEDCIIDNIHQTNTGATRAVFRFTGDSSTLTFNRCQITNCSGNDKAVVCRNGTVTSCKVIIRNSIISGTTVKPFIDGTGLTVEITNSNFINNNTSGGSAAVSLPSSTSITNSIFYNSTLAGSGSLNYSYYNGSTGSLTPTNSASFSTASEVFADDVDFYPATTFAGIDAGDNSVAVADDKDIVGNERIVNSTIDIGAYENIPAPIGIAGNNIISVGTSEVAYYSYNAAVQLPLVVMDGCTPDPIDGVIFTGIAPNYIANITTLKAPRTITFSATQANYEVSVNTTNATVTSPTLVEGKYNSTSSSVIYFTIDERTENPVVTVNGNPVTPVQLSENDYSITLEGISGPTTVVISASLKQYEVAINAEDHISITSETVNTVTIGDDLTIDFTVAAGYHTPYVSVNGKKTEATKIEGVYSFTIPAVIAAQTINISAFAANVLPVSEDTYVNNKSASTNYISAPMIGVGGDISNSYTNTKGYLYFDLSAYKEVLLQNYNKARLFVVFESNNSKGFEERLSVRTVLDNVKSTGLSSLTWDNSGEVASTYSGNEIIQGAVAMTTTSLVNVKDSVDISQNVFEALASDGVLWYQLAMISSNGGSKNDGHLAWLHSLENGNVNYVPQLVFSKLPIVTVDAKSGITVVTPTEAGPYLVEEDESFIVTFTVSGGKAPIVKINGINATAEQLNEVEGVYTLTLSSVTEDTTIELTQDVGTGLNTASHNDIQVYTHGLNLIVKTQETFVLEVYSVAGNLVAKQNAVGTTSITLERGSYIVKADTQVYKILVK